MTANADAQEVQLLTTDALRRSRWLRLRPADSRWLVQEAVAYLRCATADGHQGQRLRIHLDGLVRQRYGNPVAVWFLANVVLPILVQMVLQWWLSRRGQ